MPNEKRKRPNAQKHGAFSVIPIIPGEDPRKFEELLIKLTEEWMPNGLTEEDAVSTIANAMWRKRRTQRFLVVKLMANSVDINHPAFDVELGLRDLAAVVKSRPQKAFKEYARAYLLADRLIYFEQKFQRSNSNPIRNGKMQS
jgi:hypothetical protein